LDAVRNGEGPKPKGGDEKLGGEENLEAITFPLSIHNGTQRPFPPRSPPLGARFPQLYNSHLVGVRVQLLPRVDQPSATIHTHGILDKPKSAYDYTDEDEFTTEQKTDVEERQGQRRGEGEEEERERVAGVCTTAAPLVTDE
jgi:hypothetical protein